MHKILIVFLFINTVIFSQEISTQTFSYPDKNIEIYTLGLDNIVLQTATSNKIEITLNDVNTGKHHITTEQKDGVLKVHFNLQSIDTEERIFRKFITKRLNRASAIIKVPKDKKITFLGEQIDIQSDNYQGDLSIFIEKGTLKLGTVKGSVEARLFTGNIYATTNNTNINITTNNGKVFINNRKVKSPFTEKRSTFLKTFSVKSINANVWLTTK